MFCYLSRDVSYSSCDLYPDTINIIRDSTCHIRITENISLSYNQVTLYVDENTTKHKKKYTTKYKINIITWKHDFCKNKIKSFIYGCIDNIYNL